MDLREQNTMKLEAEKRKRRLVARLDCSTKIGSSRRKG
jgi:hypothetical protein